jgi:hypothetical protein
MFSLLAWHTLNKQRTWRWKSWRTFPMPAYDTERFDPPAPLARVALRNPDDGAVLPDVLGMWRGREDMQDSTAWVHSLRRRE